MSARLPLTRKLAFATVAVVLLLLLAEGLASSLLAVRHAVVTEGLRETSHAEYDPELGWRNRANVVVHDIYDPGSVFTTNGQRWRSTAGDYTREIPAGRYRIVCLGDSFTMGYGVSDDETWPAQMEALRPQLQVVNMALGGWGLGQMYLAYRRDGQELDADLVVMAFIRRDFDRMLRDEFLGYGKPVLRPDNGGLRVDNVPVPEGWGWHAWTRGAFAFLDRLALARAVRGLLGSDAREPPSDPAEFGPVAGRIFDAMRDLCAQRGRDFVLVYLPVPDALAAEPTAEAVWTERHAREAGIPFINLVPAFEALPPRELVKMSRVQDRHYTAAGNRFAAQALLRELRARWPRIP